MRWSRRYATIVIQQHATHAIACEILLSIANMIVRAAHVHATDLKISMIQYPDGTLLPFSIPDIIAAHPRDPNPVYSIGSDSVPVDHEPPLNMRTDYLTASEFTQPS